MQTIRKETSLPRHYRILALFFGDSYSLCMQQSEQAVTRFMPRKKGLDSYSTSQTCVKALAKPAVSSACHTAESCVVQYMPKSLMLTHNGRSSWLLPASYVLVGPCRCMCSLVNGVVGRCRTSVLRALPSSNLTLKELELTISLHNAHR